MPLDDAASAPLPLDTNTPGKVYTEHNLSLRVPATIQLLAWRNRPAAEVLEDGRRAVYGGGNVIGVGKVPRPFANYDWTRYSDDIGSLFGYFWLMLFSVQYGAVRSDSASADTIQQAWRFFQRQTKPWFERAGSAAVAWMDTAVRRVSNEGSAAAQLDGALQSLQTIYLTGDSVRASLAQESGEYANQQRLVAAYDAEIRYLAAAAGIGLGDNQPMLNVLQQLVAGGQHAAQTQPVLMLAAMLPSAPLVQLMRQTTAANPGAEKALKAALERAGKLEADVTVQKSTIKALKDTLDRSGDAGKMRDLEVAVSDYRKTTTTAAELKEMRTALRQAEDNLAAAAQAAIIRPGLIDELRRVAPGAGVSDAAYQATAAKLAETRAELAVAKMTVQTLSESKLARKAQELQDSVDRAQAELRDLRAGAATAAELKALRADIQTAASDVAQRSLASYVIPDDIVQQLRQSAAPGSRENDPLVVASQKRLTNEGKLLAELEVQRGRNSELAAQLRRAEARLATPPAAQAALIRERDDARQELARLRSASSPAAPSDPSTAELQRLLGVVRSDNAKLIAENKEKNAQIAKLAKGLDAPSRSSTTVAPASSVVPDPDVAGLRSAYEAANSRIDALNADIVAKNTEIERLRATQAAQAVLADSLAQQMRDVAVRPPPQDTESTLIELAQLRSMNTALNEAQARLDADNRALSEAQQRLEQENIRLTVSIQQLHQSCESTASVERENAQLVENIRSNNAEIERLRATQSAQAVAPESFMQLMRDTAAARLQTEINELKATISNQKADLDRIRQQRTALKTELKAAKAAALQGQGELAPRLAESMAAIDAANTRIGDLEQDNGQLGDIIASLRADAEANQAQIEAISIAIERLTRENADIKNQNVALEAELNASDIAEDRDVYLKYIIAPETAEAYRELIRIQTNTAPSTSSFQAGRIPAISSAKSAGRPKSTGKPVAKSAPKKKAFDSSD